MAPQQREPWTFNSMKSNKPKSNEPAAAPAAAPTNEPTSSEMTPGARHEPPTARKRHRDDDESDGEKIEMDTQNRESSTSSGPPAEDKACVTKRPRLSEIAGGSRTAVVETSSAPSPKSSRATQLRVVQELAAKKAKLAKLIATRDARHQDRADQQGKKREAWRPTYDTREQKRTRLTEEFHRRQQAESEEKARKLEEEARLVEEAHLRQKAESDEKVRKLEEEARQYEEEADRLRQITIDEEQRNKDVAMEAAQRRTAHEAEVEAIKRMRHYVRMDFEGLMAAKKEGKPLEQLSAEAQAPSKQDLLNRLSEHWQTYGSEFKTFKLEDFKSVLHVQRIDFGAVAPAVNIMLLLGFHNRTPEELIATGWNIKVLKRMSEVLADPKSMEVRETRLLKDRIEQIIWLLKDAHSQLSASASASIPLAASRSSSLSASTSSLWTETHRTQQTTPDTSPEFVRVQRTGAFEKKPFGDTVPMEVDNEEAVSHLTVKPTAAPRARRQVTIPEASSSKKPGGKGTKARMSQAPCRYGSHCNNLPRCGFWHGRGTREHKQAQRQKDKARMSNIPCRNGPQCHQRPTCGFGHVVRF